MMKPHTVQQLLQVFQLFWENHAGGMPLHRSYHEAVRAVARNYSVTYQTIGDACRRRLELTNINELYEMSISWVRGEPRALLHQLKEHSDPVAHSAIEKFFIMTEPTTPPKSEPSVGVGAKEGPETVSFRLGVPDARMLRALAELEGISAGELTARVVSAAVRERMKVVARGFIDERPAHA